MIKKEFINKNQSNIISALKKNLGLSFNEIKKLLRKGDIKVNNKRIKTDIMLEGKELVQCFLPDPNIDIIYQDENLLVVDKPKKLETISQKNNDSVYNMLSKKYVFCKPCHRLDTNTTGINVFALNQTSYNEVLSAFKQNKAEKIYLAIAGGNIKQNECLNHYLLKDSTNAKVKIFDNKVKNSVEVSTEYKQLEKLNEDLSLLEIKIKTGKTHQIRAHLAHVGIFILGDRKYGNSELNKKYKKQTQCLTSYSIKFDFSPNSELYYLSNTKFVLNNNKDKTFNLGDILC